MTMDLITPALILLSSFIFAEPAAILQDPSPGQPAQQLQEQLDSFWRSHDLPGVTAGIALKDGTSMGLAAGFSDLEARTPMQPDDRMLAASVGKTFVAAIVLQLIQEGRVSLEDSLRKWLGGEEWFDRLSNSSDIRIRMLLNHTSGVVPHLETDLFTKILEADRDKAWHPEELISLSLGQPALFQAGTGWAYSDTNYILVGMVIERVTKRPYYETLEDRLLEPLGLNDTLPSDSRRIPGLVQGYLGSEAHFGVSKTLEKGRFFINLQYEWTGGGLASTSRDLAQWAMALYEGQAFSPELLKEMLEGVPTGQGARYGLGVIIAETALGKSYGHGGSMPGYRTLMMYFPEHRFAIAVQFNTSDPQKVDRQTLIDCVTSLGQVILNYQPQ